MPARLPQPPVDLANESLHRSLNDLIAFVRQTYDQGSKHQEFTQSQIDQFTDLTNLGTILFNKDTQESNVSYFDSGSNSVKWRPV